jgi:hypothetical protein
MSVTPPPASKPRDGGRVVLWDGALASRSPLFWPIAEALERLARGAGEGSAFPQPETIDEALGGPAGIRFERQRPVSRRRRQPRDPAMMYDARIAQEGCVPTRPGSWHDLMNALVWATFPLAKRALHARQHALVVPAAPGESARRSREQDALALFDEGGLVVTRGAGATEAPTEEELAAEIEAGKATAIVFGHAIYEGIVLGRTAPLGSVVCVSSTPAGVDAALATVIADRGRLVEPSTMLRLRADERLVPGT